MSVTRFTYQMTRLRLMEEGEWLLWYFMLKEI